MRALNMRRTQGAALVVLVSLLAAGDRVHANLYPRASETRETLSLDGLWNFRTSPVSDKLLGITNQWFKRDLSETGKVILMPVPSSYNDITTDGSVRDHIGAVWYDRTFYVSDSWFKQNKTIWLRFSSVSYLAAVWVNGELAMSHEIGHLPFEANITNLLRPGQRNRVTVACDNSLSTTTVPQGYQIKVPNDEGMVLVQRYTFDFFNYAGIDRPVTLYMMPSVYIEDITVRTDVDVNSTGIVDYEVFLGGDYNINENFICFVRLLDHADNVVAKGDENGKPNGTITVPLARLWWPYLMHSDPGYMYTLEVSIYSNEADERLDIYRLPVGIRSLKWSNRTFLINEKPIYLHGFGRHEDSDIRGKGLDLALVSRDYNLIKWVGGNAYRTSHYPYADEIMDMADRNGIMIVNECPSVDTDLNFYCGTEEGPSFFDCVLNKSGFTAELLKKHKHSLTELIQRDKNRPSVIAWSIANEPRSANVAANKYFGEVVKYVKTLDTTRPTTMAISVSVKDDKAGQHLDIISFNRYNGWYSNAGRVDMITQKVIDEATAWHAKYNKTVLMSEYGADTYEGLHLYPSYVWSEEYQVEIMSQHFKAFDKLRAKGFFIGEFIWNFADFKTAQTTTRVGGNKKGIFTRNRQPKASAFHLRSRYHKLAHELYNSPLPTDLKRYDVQKITIKNSTKDEL